ncbi:MAG: hypothetical protein ACTSPY_15950 [Candidatus Helarchaeota archaeon]
MKNSQKNKKYLLIALVILIFSISIIYSLNLSSITAQKYNNLQDIPLGLSPTSPNDCDIYALETNGSVFESDTGNSWNLQGTPPLGYDFVSTATDNNHTYVLTNDGQIFRHKNSTWNSPTWSKLQVPLPRKSNGWTSIDVNNMYIYVLHADGDTYRILKDPGWPNPGNWVQSSNPIPLAIPPPLFGGETSFVSIATDWNDSFCFVLRNNGEVYRHFCDSSSIWGIPGSWTSPASTWDIYASYGGAAPLTLEHNDGTGMYWGIPTTAWVSIDVYDNYYEQNYTVYVLHNSGLVGRHTNLLNWNIDLWINPTEPWILDPRWPLDWPGIFKSDTNFVSIACNDMDIFIMQNDGTVYWIPEWDFKYATTYPSWAWVNPPFGTSPLPLTNESQTTAFVSIDAWIAPFILKNDGKAWRNLKYNNQTGGVWDDCWDNRQNNGKGTLYPNVFSYCSITAYTTSTLYILSKNGTIYNSTDKGLNWQKFGNIGNGYDSGWVSIAAGNHKNNSKLYALYNNGTVIMIDTGVFQIQNYGTSSAGFNSWVSITCDSNSTIYTLRNYGDVSYKYNGTGMNWTAKGTTIGDKIHQDSSWVSIEAHHTNMTILVVRNDRALDASIPGSATLWNNIAISISYTSHVALTYNNKYIWVLQNMGGISRSLYNIINFNFGSTVPGNTGFVDICSPIDNKPWSNHPVDAIVLKYSTYSINWFMYDDVGVSHYRLFLNGTVVWPWFTLTVNGSLVSVQVNTQSSTVLNYTIQFNDSANQINTDTVFITIDRLPWDDDPTDILSDHYPFGISYVNWTLFDDWNGSHYRVFVNGTPSNWNTWSNTSIVQYPVNTTTLGIFNYTIQYNDSRGFVNSDTVFITVRDRFIPWSNSPTDIITNITGSETVNWTLWDSYAPGYYRVIINGTPSNWNTWTNGTNIQYPINRSLIGKFNYTIQYNDSVGNWGTPDTVWVTIKDDIPPWSNSPVNITTNRFGTENINWTLWDNIAPGYYQVIINNTNKSSWIPWTNGTNIQYPIDRSAPGIFNYTIYYNDSFGNMGIPDTVYITIEDLSPTSNSPADIITGPTGTNYIQWILTDEYGPSYYRVYINSKPGNWTTWTNNSVLNYTIKKDIPGVFNYTIVYNDSGNNWGNPDTVFVSVDLNGPIAFDPIPGNNTFTSNTLPNINISLLDFLAGINTSSIEMYVNSVKESPIISSYYTNWLSPWIISSESDVDSTEPAIATDMFGNIHVVWKDSTNYSGSGTDIDIFYKFWNSTTGIWSLPEVVSTESNSTTYSPAIDVDQKGNVYVAWNEYVGDYDIFYKYRNATTGIWSAVEIVSPSPDQPSYSPGVAVDISGNVHIVWYDWADYDGQGDGLNEDIFHRIWNASTKSWGSVNGLTAGSTNIFTYPVIKADNFGNVHLTYIEINNTGSPKYYINYTNWNGSTGIWSNSIRISIGTAVMVDPRHSRFVIDDYSNIYLAWSESTSYGNSGNDRDIFYKRWDSQNKTWGSIDVVSVGSSTNSYGPSIAYDGFGNIYVVWYEGNQIYYNIKNATTSTWSSAILFSTESSGTAMYPSIISTKTGSIHVIFQDNTDYEGSGSTDIDIIHKMLINNYIWQVGWTPSSAYAHGQVINVSIKVKDMFNNSMPFYNWSFTIDIIAPYTSNPNPQDSSYTNDATPFISIDLTDIDSGIDENTIKMAINGSIIAHQWNGTTITFNVTIPYNNGDYIFVQVNASDNAGNIMNPFSWRFYIDIQGPVASNPFPANNTYINNSLPTIIVMLTDNLSGVSPSSITLVIEGTAVGHIWNGTHVYYTVISPYPNGQIVHVNLDASDNIGNSMLTYSWSFTIDLVAPSCANPNPNNQSATNNNNTVISVSLIESLSGIAQDTVRMNVNGTIYNLTAAELVFSNGTLQFTPSSPFNDGYINIYVDASDNAGNVMAPYYWQFIIDTNPPVVINHIPQNQSYTNDNYQQITVSLFDGGIGVDFNTVNLTVNGTLYNYLSPEISFFGNSVIFNPTTAFNDGMINVSISILDRANNLMPIYYWQFYVDLQLPQAYNPSPSNNSLVNIKKPNISMTLLDDNEINESTIILTVAGTNYQLSNALIYNNVTGLLTFYPQTNFTDGQNVVVVLQANDSAGNQLPHFSFSFTIDTIIPVVNILSPQPQTYTTTTIWVNLTCNDANWNSTWYRIYNISDSQWLTPTNVSWTTNTTIILQDQKTYQIFAWVNDSAGNVQDINISITFSIDISAPSITIIAPMNKTYGYTNVKIIVDNSSSLTAISSIWFRYSNNSFTNNFSLYWNGTYWINDTTIFSEKSILLQVFANNSGGRLAKSEVWFTVDMTAPTINITSPAEGAILSKIVQFDLVDLGSNDSDIVQIIFEYNYNGTWITYNNWQKGVNLSWSISSVNIFFVNSNNMPDANTYGFRFIALDGAPNDGYAYVGQVQALTVDNTPPEIVEITSVIDSDGVPYPGYYNGRVIIQYNANDLLSGLNTEVELYDQSGWILNYTSNPVHWDTTAADDGIHQLRIRVFDLAGNYNTSSVTIIIVDNTDPSIPSITNVSDNFGHTLSFGYFNGTIIVQFNAFDSLSGISLVQLWEGTNFIASNNSANTITFNSIGTLGDGIYNFVLYAFDKCLNSETSLFSPVTVRIDNNKPVWREKTPNLLFEVEDSSQFLYWQLTDVFPSNYTIYSQTNTTLDSGTWVSGSNITYNLGALYIGNRSYRIVIRDIIGYSVETTVWVCVRNNTIKAGIQTLLTFDSLFEGLNIIILTNLPGNLTARERSDPSSGQYPPGFIVISGIFVDITFITEYSGQLTLDVRIFIRLDQSFIQTNRIDLTSLRIGYFEGGIWHLVNTGFNGTAFEVSINLNHLTYFAVFGKISGGTGGGFEWTWLIIIIIIAAAAGIIVTTIIIKRKPEKTTPTPSKRKVINAEKLIIERDNYIDAAENALRTGDIKEAIRYFEKIGNISRELGEYDLYNQCVDKVKELRASLISAISTTQPAEAPPSEVPVPIQDDDDVKVLRGGEVVGDKIIYKVKIQNNTKFNITDVTVFLISYPRECMGLTTKETRQVPKIESGGFRSLEFEFEPHKDCVEGTVHASVTYIDHLNQSHTKSVQPFTIRSVCDLLKPYRVDEEEFDKMILGWQKTGDFKKVNVNIYDLFERSKLTLERHNFFIVTSKLYESEDTPLVRGLIKAFAEGKYANKKIGMLIEMIGNKQGALSQIRTSSTSEDEGMMASPISEVIDDFSQAGLSLDKMSPQEQEAFIKEKSLQSLRYLLILHKESGITIFSVNFSEQKLDPDLVSGFLSAISSFGMELSGGQSIGIRKMEYESLKIVLQQGNYVNVGLILDDFPEQWLDLRLKTFVKALETQYKEYLEKWSGDVRPFKDIGILFARIFEIQEE